MPRNVSKASVFKGSQKWTQLYVNRFCDELDSAVRKCASMGDDVAISWLSQLASDEYAEYSDQSFVERLGLRDLSVPLSDFWPARGAHWDALAKTSVGGVILLEAKANVRELASGPTGAKSDASKALVLDALRRVQGFIGVPAPRNRPELWANAFYQYANRIAHLYFLRELNSVDASLVFLYFVGDKDAGAGVVNSIREWELLIKLVEACLGVRNSCEMMKHVHHVFLDAEDRAGDDL